MYIDEKFEVLEVENLVDMFCLSTLIALLSELKGTVAILVG